MPTLVVQGTRDEVVDPVLVELSNDQQVACHFPERGDDRTEIAIQAMDFSSQAAHGENK